MKPCCTRSNTTKRSLSTVPRYARHASAVYLLTFALALPLTCRRLHNSVYFVRGNNSTAAERQTLRVTNNGRLARAEAVLKALNASTPVQKNIGQVDVAISVITVSRNRHKVDDYEPRYLSQVIAELLVLQARQDLLNVELTVCDVDVDPDAYEEVTALKPLVSVFHKYEHKPSTNLHSLEKEKQDYITCLQHALNATNASYVFLIEDDALPSSDLFLVLHHTIQLHLNHNYHHNEFHAPDANTAFVKFYHPPRLLSYIALESERLSELLALACVLGTLVTVVYWRSSSPLTSTPSSDLYISWIVNIMYFALLALAIGRANIQQLRHWCSPYFYSYTPAPSCCTPAVLYPREAARQVSGFLNQTLCKKNFGKDSALDMFLHTTNWKSFLVQPNTFTHIGQYSSIRKKLVDPFVVN